MKPFVGLSGWHRGPDRGCYESDDRRAAVEKVWRKKAWKLWLYEGWLRRSSKLVGMYPTRKAAMRAYQPNTPPCVTGAASDMPCQEGRP
jgi:hypothetical protein